MKLGSFLGFAGDPGMHEEHQKKTLRFADLAPSAWFTRRESSSIWLSGYRVLRVPAENLASGPKIIDLTDGRAFLLHGTLKYIDHSQATIQILTDQQWAFDASTIKEQEAPEGVYLVLVAPFDVDGKRGDEARTRRNISVVTGLLAALNGFNMVYEHLFDNIVSLGESRISGVTPSVTNPLWFPAPDVRQSRLDTISAADTSISRKGQRDRERIRLSLIWFKTALRDDGVNAYLKYWVALETLGMPDTTNIRPLVESLARVYKISYEDARDRFSLGKLFSLRGRIVHRGEIMPIRGELLKYLEALYVDILLECLGLPPDGRAHGLINGGFALDKYFPE